MFYGVFNVADHGSSHYEQFPNAKIFRFKPPRPHCRPLKIFKFFVAKNMFLVVFYSMSLITSLIIVFQSEHLYQEMSTFTKIKKIDSFLYFSFQLLYCISFQISIENKWLLLPDEDTSLGKNKFITLQVSGRLCEAKPKRRDHVYKYVGKVCFIFIHESLFLFTSLIFIHESYIGTSS